MQLNSDFARAVVLRTADIPWRQAPFSGVQYRTLEQDGADGRRATFVVRYEAGSHLPRTRMRWEKRSSCCKVSLLMSQVCMLQAAT